MSPFRQRLPLRLEFHTGCTESPHHREDPKERGKKGVWEGQVEVWESLTPRPGAQPSTPREELQLAVSSFNFSHSQPEQSSWETEKKVTRKAHEQIRG